MKDIFKRAKEGLRASQAHQLPDHPITEGQEIEIGLRQKNRKEVHPSHIEFELHSQGSREENGSEPRWARGNQRVVMPQKK